MNGVINIQMASAEQILVRVQILRNSYMSKLQYTYVADCAED